MQEVGYSIRTRNQPFLSSFVTYPWACASCASCLSNLAYPKTMMPMIIQNHDGPLKKKHAGFLTSKIRKLQYILAIKHGYAGDSTLFSSNLNLHFPTFLESWRCFPALNLLLCGSRWQVQLAAGALFLDPMVSGNTFIVLPGDGTGLPSWGLWNLAQP